MVHRENLEKVLRIQACVAQCQLSEGTCCDEEEYPKITQEIIYDPNQFMGEIDYRG